MRHPEDVIPFYIMNYRIKDEIGNILLLISRWMTLDISYF